MMSFVKNLRPRSLLGCIGAAWMIGLGGCMELPDGNYSFAEYRAEPAELQHDLYFVPGKPQLAKGETERLRTALGQLGLTPEDDILVHLNSTGSEAVDVRRIASVRKAVSGARARVRIFAKPGFASVDRFPDVGLVQVMRYGRVRVVCPYQGNDFADERWDRSELLMGCNNAINIATMTNEPRDLTAPGSHGGSSAISQVGAVERYRADAVKTVTVDSFGGL